MLTLSQAEGLDWSNQRLVPRWHWSSYGGCILVGWLSGFWAQTDSVATSKNATFVRRLGEAAAPEGGECGPCPNLALYTLAFALQLRKNHWKPPVRVSERQSADQLRTQFVKSIWPSRTMASTGLLAPAALGFRVRRRGQPSVSVSICRVAALGDSSR
jgi:hypothetical protein